MPETKLKQQYFDPQWHDWFVDQHLVDFDAFWSLDLDEVETGNFDRGGWSRVFRFEREGKTFYVKRQNNHRCYSPRTLPFKVPTLKAEFDKIHLYHKHDIPCLEVAYFGWRKGRGSDQAILVTEALDNYQPLDVLLKSQNQLPLSRKRHIFDVIGKAVARLHGAGIEHFNLYPKHIFVGHEGQLPEIRFIDLETSRSNMGLKSRKLRDLETLSRRSHWVSRTDKLRVLLAYSAKNRVDRRLRKEITTITNRTANKLRRR